MRVKKSRTEDNMAASHIRRIVVMAFVCIFFIPLISHAEIIFQDNFDSHPDWTNKKGSPIPKGWTGRSVKDVPPGDLPCGEIKSAAGMSGKGFRCNVKANRKLQAAGLHKKFAVADALHDELYIRWYQRYSANFHWMRPRPKSRSQGHKFIRISHNTPPWKGALARIGWHMGKLYFYSETGGHIIYIPYTWEQFNEKVGCGFDCYGSDKWRCIELRIKLNTKYKGKPSNGIIQIWIDGQLVSDNRNVFARKSPEQHIERIQLGGNMCCPDIDITTPYYYVDIDNFVVSTTYIGPLRLPSRPSGLKILK